MPVEILRTLYGQILKNELKIETIPVFPEESIPNYLTNLHVAEFDDPSSNIRVNYQNKLIALGGWLTLMI